VLCVLCVCVCVCVCVWLLFVVCLCVCLLNYLFFVSLTFNTGSGMQGLQLWLLSKAKMADCQWNINLWDFAIGELGFFPRNCWGICQGLPCYHGLHILPMVNSVRKNWLFDRWVIKYLVWQFSKLFEFHDLVHYSSRTKLLNYALIIWLIMR